MTSKRAKFYAPDAEKSIDVLRYGRQDRQTAHVFSAIQYGQMAVLKWLYSNCVHDLRKYKTYSGRGVAHEAAWRRRLPVLQWLHNRGFLDPNQQDIGGWTVSQCAGSQDIINWFERLESE